MRGLRYGPALLAVGVALGFRLALHPLLGDRQPFATFYVAVAITAWFCGLGPALLVLGLGGLCADYFIIPPLHRVGFAGAADAVMYAMYVLVGLVLAGSSHAMRRAERQAEERAGALAQSQAAFRESEERLAAIIGAATDAIITLDADHRVILFNGAAEKMFRCTADEALGQRLDRFIPEAVRDRHEGYIRTFGEAGVGLRAMGGERVLTAVRADGEQFPMEAQISQVTVGGEKLFTVVIRDVTERKRAEAERDDLLRRERETRERAEAATRLLARVQVIADAALRSLSVDELLRELLVRVRSVLETDTAVILLREDGVLRVRAALGLEEELHRDVRVPIGEGFAGQVAAERRPVVLEEVDHDRVVSEYFRDKGIHSLAGVPLELQGSVSGVLHVGTIRPRRFTDDEVHVLQLAGERIAVAVERAAAHDAEREARTAAEAASRAKDEFLSVISHELRTPLTAMTNWLRVLRTDKGPLASRAIESIDRSARAQAKLIEDLLDVSRIVTGHMRLDLRPVDLPAVIRGAVETIRPTADAKGVRMLADLDTPAMVSGDPDRLQQVAWNLLSNAVKFTPRGGLVKVRVEGAADRDVRFVVRDTGRGISPQFLPHIFERFRQADAAATRRHGGLGLGLAIVRHLAELHGGTVEVESAGEGLGAVFTVTLPRVVEHVGVSGDGDSGAAGV